MYSDENTKLKSARHSSREVLRDLIRRKIFLNEDLDRIEYELDNIPSCMYKKRLNLIREFEYKINEAHLIQDVLNQNGIP